MHGRVMCSSQFVVCMMNYAVRERERRVLNAKTIITSPGLNMQLFPSDVEKKCKGL